MKAQLMQAVLDRRVVSFDLDGKHRVGEPHMLGEMAEGLAIELYQTDGDSIRGRLPDWRSCYLDKMSELTITNETFTPRDSFNRHRLRWARVLASVT